MDIDMTIPAGADPAADLVPAADLAAAAAGEEAAAAAEEAAASGEEEAATPVEQPPADEPLIGDGLIKVADALGMTWAAYQLYPEPASTPAWARAVELFRSSDAYPAGLEVGPDNFVMDGVDVPSGVEGAARAARALFVHEVAALSFQAPPPDEDLLRLFDALYSEPGELARVGGVRAVLTNAGVSSIEVVTRSPLEESDDKVEAGRHADVKEIVDTGLDPEALAARIRGAGGSDPDAVTERFTTWFEDVLGKVESEDHLGREAVVTIFVESFFYLDAEHRLAIIEYCLSARTKPAYQILLDQFSGHDLAAMAGDLSPSSREELTDYARVSIDDGRPEELVAMLQTPAEVEEARQAVAGRIAELLDEEGPEVGRGATFARIRSQIAALPPPSGMGRRVLRDLLRVEERDARFRRLLRIWTGKIARSIHEGDWDEAERWLDAALAHPTYPEERAQQVDEAMVSMANDDMVGALLGDLEAGRIPSVAMRLIEAWGTRVTDRLVNELAEEEDPAKRRALIDVLAVVSSSDATGLINHLSDSRWYLVRNLAIAMGKTGRPEVAPRLKHLAATHADHRVRVEALRSLMPVSIRQGAAAALKALRDDHKRVRQAALAVLAAVEDERADDALAEALEAKEVPTEVKLRVIEVLRERGTPASRRALEALAGKRSLVGAGRSLRQAAQDALKGAQ